MGLQRQPEPFSGLLLTAPVFLTYHLGILFIDLRNGVDWVTGLTFDLLAHSVPAYVAATLALAGGLWLVGRIQSKRGRLQPPKISWVLFESAVWALLMALGVSWATAQLSSVWSPMAAGAMPAMGPIDKIVMAAGAGFHEEVVFRALLVGGLFSLLARIGWPDWRRVLTAVVFSSAMFALAHHFGPYGDGLDLTAFTFRFFAGVYLAGLYFARGFAVVVYTHTLYDILVFFVFAG